MEPSASDKEKRRLSSMYEDEVPPHMWEAKDDHKASPVQANRKKTSSVRGSMIRSTLVDMKSSVGRASSFLKHEATEENIAFIFCCLNSQLSYGIGLASGVLTYWIYNEEHPIGIPDYTYCMAALCIFDIIASTALPYFIANFGYAKISLSVSGFRICCLLLLTTYLVDNPPFKLPHSIFTLIVSLPGSVCPIFVIGATRLDEMMQRRFPQLRLAANFLPILTTSTTYAATTFVIYGLSLQLAFLVMLTFAIITFLVEAYFSFVKHYFDSRIEPISVGNFFRKLHQFFTVELIVKAWNADGVLATTWVIFGWYVPVFSSASGGPYTIREIAKSALIYAIPVCSLGCMMTCGFFVWQSWGVREEDILLKKIIASHTLMSWAAKITYLSGLLWFRKYGLPVMSVVCPFALGMNFATPNSMIMLLSVPNELAVPYTGFAQVSFCLLIYGVNIWMNYFGGSFGTGTYAEGFSRIFFIASVACLLPLSLWTYYEDFYLKEERTFKSMYYKRNSKIGNIVKVKIPPAPKS